MLIINVNNNNVNNKNANVNNKVNASCTTSTRIIV